MKTWLSALSVLLLIGMATADTWGNWTVKDWEDTTGSQLGTIFGDGKYCFAGTLSSDGESCVGGYTIEVGSVIMAIFIMGFIFIWASVSGIAWDGVFFLMMIVLVLLAAPVGGILGTTAWGIYDLLWVVAIMSILYRVILRRG